MNQFILLLLVTGVRGLNLDYLDPTKLQTKASPTVQRNAALRIIQSISAHQAVEIEVDPTLFSDKKDVFSLKTSKDKLIIRASSGVAAVWGFNHFLKNYCKSQIAWQVQRVTIPSTLPEVDETVVANDRFRYYQNVCTVSYSFLWWKVKEWTTHVAWMALNGINLALAPVAQEAAWAKVYRQLGMTEQEIDQHFTGPAFLSWLRMGNVHGWGGPLPKSWHEGQKNIQKNIVELMFELGIVPVFPAFSGHVPKAFERIFPNTTLYSVVKWNRFDEDYCCGLYLDPNDPLFKRISKMFLTEVTGGTDTGHIYTSDPFNEVKIQPWSTSLVRDTARAIHTSLSEFDEKSVWLLQNWMFVSDPVMWPMARVKTLLTSVPNGRLLLLDLQSEQWPQYNLYDMYYGQPFIWSMLHNFGATLGMFGNIVTINKDVYEARSQNGSTMIGIGLTPEGINQNYVVYDLMLESAWRKGPVVDMEAWAREYARRRYGCDAASEAWKYLLKSVYSFNSLNKMRGKYVVTRRPSFRLKPWAWYKSSDLMEALKNFVYINDTNCDCEGFKYDLVDVTRQALQYRAEQLYLKVLIDRYSTVKTLNATIIQFLDAMQDMSLILSESEHFSAINWVKDASAWATNLSELNTYELNAKNQITLWGPKGEITDYACKQWAEMFLYYYIPRWSLFLNTFLEAQANDNVWNEKTTQDYIRVVVEETFTTRPFDKITPSMDVRVLAVKLYEKWASIVLDDLPMSMVKVDSGKRTTFADVDFSSEVDDPTVVMLWSTTPIV
ncbi:putative alpha-N-acetyl glucosaminidase [Operophtera brumata]|uniref:Putative alpha-N-acetyl glucosaminidase n=1 Tax=Operophtera brumata TaxID=104452 RepID=A0A0L7L8H5_OPEBR|nr:putative alpha-N-acetyl glucosaminidase [Operophtera brumata]